VATLTPWQRVYKKFGMSRSEFARAIGRHRSKISRELNNDKGLISGRDQEMLLETAEKLGINLTASDVVPTRPK